MSQNLEILATYKGAIQQFDNPTGVVIVGNFAPEGADAIAAIEKAELEKFAYFQGKGKDGTDETDRMTMNKTYRLFGRWKGYFNKRLGYEVTQFCFTDFVEHTPRSKSGLIDYLTVHGKGKRIGPSKARMLVEKLGADEVLNICRTNHQHVAELIGIEPHQARAFADSLQEQQATENTVLELNQILGKRGFPESLTKKLVKRWRNSAPAVIQDDPYLLMDFRGVGFALADKLWLDLGKDVRDIRRQTMCIWSILNSSRDGHIWHRANKIVAKFQTMIPGDTDARAAILHGKEIAARNETPHGALATIRTNGKNGPLATEGDTLWIAIDSLAKDERDIAVALAVAKDETCVDVMTQYSQEEDIRLSYLHHATCTRCHRHLTAPMVHVLDERPYGPTCITKMPGGETAEALPLEVWIAQNPIVDRFIREEPAGIIRVTEALLWPDPSTICGENFSDHQRDAIANATTERVGILTGSPGTGKTTSIAALVRAVLKIGYVGMHQIAMAAPTGKATVRMTQSFEDKGLRMQCRTWHSLLGTSKETSSETDGWAFAHGKKMPWPYKIIIGDEDSMPDTSIKRCIFDARAHGAHFLFVGDVNQLAPVGPGAPFRDMIAAGVPTGELTEIHRNAGGIVKACKLIKEGKPWAHEFVDNWDSNLTITDDRTDTQKLNSVLTLMEEQINNGIDPIWDMQLLIAVNEKSELSRSKMNKHLQDAFNSNAEIKGTKFRLGDKVVCLSNNEYPQVDQKLPVYVANGEVGVVRDIDQKSRCMQVELQFPERLIRVYFGSDRKKGDTITPGTSDWDLGYAFTPHKFQGSECSKVFTILDSYRGARNICDRSWVTTSLSRAVDKQIVVGTADLAEQFTRTLRISERKTFLRERIIVANLNRSGELAGL